jgi:60 kDa SS-A/Ro ribonucleoprotein
MQQYTNHYSGKRAKQGEKIPGKRKAMTKTSDGAFAFKLDDWGRLDRFLILGADSPTYYASAAKMARMNAKVVERCIAADALRTIKRIAEISQAGRAPNNDPALFALAMCTALGSVDARRVAMEVLPRVARIGTHLFHFVRYAEELGQGWGRSFRRGISRWFNDQDLDDLVYQVIKYRQRDGWSMNDLLQLCHAKPGGDVARNALYRYLTWNELGNALPERAYAAHDLSRTTDAKHAVRLIRDHNLPRECVSSEMLGKVEVWEALFEKMPLGAMVRNLNKMTSIGLLDQMSSTTNMVVQRLSDVDRIRKARLHPIAILKALKTYGSGHGDRGKLSWSPVSKIVDALDGAFYKAFETVEPTNKRIGLFLDISGSMGVSDINGMNMTPREASAAMALVTAATEPNHAMWGFCGTNNGWHITSTAFRSLDITPRRRLDDVVQYVSGLPMGATDLSLPMVVAAKESIELDAFVIYTDNETNCYARPHASIALEEYRQKMGINAKLIVVAMVANKLSIADPSDAGMMDVVGFDTAAPQVMSDFVR